MTVHTFRPRRQSRSIVIGRADDQWRTTIFPPVAEFEALGFPLIADFPKADEALGYAAWLAGYFGWHLVDSTGRRSPAELDAAIEAARTAARDTYTTSERTN